MEYQRKPIVVEAIQATCEFSIGDERAAAGDFLVKMPGGEMKIMPKALFEIEYEPVSARPFGPAQVVTARQVPVPDKPPTAAEKARLREEETQTREAICATCGNDVLVRLQDKYGDCPACTEKNRELRKEQEPKRSKSSRVRCCDECGRPVPGNEIDKGLCRECSEEAYLYHAPEADA